MRPDSGGLPTLADIGDDRKKEFGRQGNGVYIFAIGPFAAIVIG